MKNKKLKEIVRQGYNKASQAYRTEDQNIEAQNKYLLWADMATAKLNDNDKILDLGCGCGLPFDRYLSKKYRITGVDISEEQIRRAKKYIQDATFICCDMSAIDFNESVFDAIVSLYALIHIPIGEQPLLFLKIHKWLKVNGIFLAIVGAVSWTGYEENWLEVSGVKMYWSHGDFDYYKKLYSKNGFTIISETFIPEGKNGHYLVLATKSV